ncbi:MAG: TRAP transporter substrate-binding protein [Lachnospiraceae bacterium]|nr:TRAP transporter substrate-binding protein [Lachnospiraceae bacterium]
MKVGNHNRKKVYLFLATAAVFLLAAGLFLFHRKKTVVPEYVFSYAENQTQDYPTTMGGIRFAELVEERTQGRIRIQVQAEGVFGSEQEVIRQMRYGGIDFARISLAQVADYIPEMKVLQLPYLYEDASHMWRVLDGEIGARFLQYPEQYDLIGLSWYDAGARNIYCSTKPVRALEDMQGMSIRVQESEMMSEMMTALGAIPVQLSYDRVYAALERNQVDGAENNWSSYEAMQHYEVAPYYTVDEHIRIPEMQICAKHTWEQLSEEDRAIILECAKESALYERKLWTEYEKTARKTVLENQVEEIVLSAEEKKKFQEAVKPIYERYEADYGEDIAQIRALGAQ